MNRAQVKSLGDSTAGRIQFDAVVDTTIAALNAIPSHCGVAGNRRVRDEEFQVYRVVGIITRVKRMRDRDIHIVLVDEAHAGDHLVVEADDPDFGKNAESPYRDKLLAARQMFDDLVSQSSAGGLIDLKGMIVQVTGIGFFDVNHLQVAGLAAASSCIQCLRLSD